MNSEVLTAALVAGLQSERVAYNNANHGAKQTPSKTALPPLFLLSALRRLVLADLVKAGICYLVEVICTLATPVIIYQLLVWVQSDAPDPGIGVAYIMCLGVASVTAFLADERCDHFSKRAGIHSRTAVCGALYAKVLAMPTVDRALSNSGEMVNLFATEASQVGGVN
jgi:hypothetical protein